MVLVRTLLGIQTKRYKCGRASYVVASALEEPCLPRGAPPAPEPLRPHLAGSEERDALAHELTALCRCPASLPIVVGAERGLVGVCRMQPMPFDHRRVAAYYQHARPDTVQRAFDTATAAQPRWERTPVDQRCAVFERAADLLAGAHRQRLVAAAVVGSAASVGRAELDVRQLVDQIRVDCHFARDLTRGRCVFDGGEAVRNANQYHGLEGFWAAISPSDSIAGAAQLALTPALVGNGVVWKPSEHAVLAAHRVLEALLQAGLPPGVINFVPCEEGAFFEAAAARPDLAGVAFGGTTRVLEHVWRRVGENVERHRRFPRVAGCGGARNLHAVHGSASLAAAVAGTARAAFEMAGQKATACTRAFVARSVMEPFTEELARAARSLVVCHPLDYRCFMSALASQETFDEVSCTLSRVGLAGGARLVCGGRADCSVGFYVEPTVLVVEDARHWLLTEALRGPLVVLHAFPDDDLRYLEWAAAQAPFAMTAAVYAQDTSWARRAVGALRDAAAMLCVNERCSELQPGQQSLGGSRKSGNGAKVRCTSCRRNARRDGLRRINIGRSAIYRVYLHGSIFYLFTSLPSRTTQMYEDRPASEECKPRRSVGGERARFVQVGSISCLLQYCCERSLREVREPSSELTSGYMHECPPQAC